MQLKKLRRRPLTVREVLIWASQYREAHGKWPTKASGVIPGTHGETWRLVDGALRHGLRGFPGGSSLAKLLAEEKGARNLTSLQSLTEQQILTWADDHHQRTGEWPTAKLGMVPNSGGEKWSAVDMALRAGVRGLPGGCSLARLLAEHRGVRNRKALPHLTEDQILSWCDLHQGRTGAWPNLQSGPIYDAPGETWMAVQMALCHGQRGLPGGSSLALVLAQHRNVRNVWTLPDLDLEQIMSWAKAWWERTGKWPNLESGSIPEAPGETWAAINHALLRGARGLPGGSSLTQWLAAGLGVRNRMDLPNLNRKSVLQWADAHLHRTGKYPTQRSGSIPEAPGETWMAVDEALRKGTRGQKGGSSLARLLAQYRGRKNHVDQPPLSQKKILAWIDAHRQRTGEWPTRNSGEVVDAPGESWKNIDLALYAGYRELPGGCSLLQLLAKKRGVRNPLDLPSLTEEQIIKWAEAHRHRTGRLPKYKDGPVVDASGETWAGVDGALRYGKRSLPGGSSLAKVLALACSGRPG